MVDQDHDKSKKIKKRPSSSREDLDQFTVLNDVASEDLSAKDMNSDPSNSLIEDAVSMGAIGNVDKKEGDSSSSVNQMLDPIENDVISEKKVDRNNDDIGRESLIDPAISNEGNSQNGGEDRGHGNDEDGVDNNNPGQGGGGPNSEKDDSETEDNSGLDIPDIDVPSNNGSGGSQGNHGNDMEIEPMIAESNGGGWHDEVSSDGTNSNGSNNDEADDNWVEVVNNSDLSNGKGKGKSKDNKEEDSLDSDDIPDTDSNNTSFSSDESGFS